MSAASRRYLVLSNFLSNKDGVFLLSARNRECCDRVVRYLKDDYSRLRLLEATSVLGISFEEALSKLAAKLATEIDQNEP